MRKADYIFDSNQIKKETGHFKKCLQEKHFARNTIKPYINYTSYFLNWLEQNRLLAEKTTYNHILQFIEYCRKNDKGDKLINRMLSAIRHYYKHLSQLKNIKNPVAGVYIKGTPRRIPSNLVDFEELEELYNAYKTIDNKKKRNKVMLGIFIYQFPTVEEIKLLQTTDINLQEGKIYIPPGRKSNGRMLELKPFQIIGIQEYLTEIRPKLLKEYTTQLFISMNGNKNVKNSIFHMFNALKKINPRVTSPTCIRMSVISHLQKSIPLRQLQYMAGHKHISSTERYRQTDTEELYKQLELFHPLSNEALT
jgi:integrase/recombinase XerD